MGILTEWLARRSTSKALMAAFIESGGEVVSIPNSFNYRESLQEMKIGSVTIGPDDTVVLFYEGIMTDKSKERLQAQVKAILPPHKGTYILEEGLRVGVIRDGSGKNQSKCSACEKVFGKNEGVFGGTAEDDKYCVKCWQTPGAIL